MSTAEEAPVHKDEATAEGDEPVPASESPCPEGSADSPIPPDDEEKTPPVMPRFQYSRDKLMLIKTYPLSQKRPDCLDASFNNSRGVWDPERWHLDRKRSETPPDELNQPPGDNHKRRVGDPRERLRKEQDGIVLSPQRRSFNSGCFVTQAQPPPAPRRPDSPGKSDRDRGEIHREIPTRRIGSGRILARERDSWDFRLDRDKEAEPPADFNPFQRGSGRDREADRFERRPYGRDFGGGDKDRHRNTTSRYGGQRGRYDNREEEPEWFSAGPTSQHDTIELRGFDESDDPGPNAKKPGTTYKANGKTISRVTLTRKTEPPAPPKAVTVAPRPKSPPAKEPPVDERATEATKDKPWRAQDAADDDQPAADYNFLDDFLKSDALPDLLSNGTEVEGPGGSRFSRYFHRESPPNRPDSRRSSMHDEMLNNIINDFTDQSITIPAMGDSELYFAPISPAANSGAPRPAPGPPAAHPPAPQSTSLLEMLQRGQGDGTKPKPTTIKSLEGAGKIQSVEELEARMRQQGLDNKGGGQPSMTPKKTEEVAAFKKLLAQVSSGKPRPPTNGPATQRHQSISLMEMFNKSQYGVDQGGPRAPHPSSNTSTEQAINLLASFNTQPAQQMQIPQDLVMKLLHVQQQQQRQQQQQEMLNKLMAANQQKAAATRPNFQAPPPSLSPLPHDPVTHQMIQTAQASRELMQRPEAQAIIHGLKLGEITTQHLMQQLQNPAMQPRHRELITSILKIYSGASPRPTSPHVPPPAPDALHQMMLQQQTQQHTQQQLRIPSPLNNAFCPPPSIISPNLGSNPNTLSVQHPGMPRRVPSPRELVVHTQNIMQSALIKKKLEEQRENYRKRQVQQSVSPNGPPPVKTVASPTPLAFTPTSVMRKMTADKEPEPVPMGMPMGGRSDLKLQILPQAAYPLQPPQLARPQQQQQQQQQVSSSWIPPTAKMPAGRPIVKGTANFQQFTGAMEFPGAQQAVAPPHRSMHPGGGYTNTVARPKMPPAVPPPNLNPLMMMYRQQAPNRGELLGSNQKLQAHMASLQQQHMPPPLQQMLQGQNYASRGDPSHQTQPMSVHRPQGMNMQGGGDISTSPTSNQLAQWFSPELLAQAKAGRLAGMPPISTMPNILSLEELERLQQSSAIHN